MTQTHPVTLDPLLDVDAKSITTTIDSDVTFTGSLEVKGGKTLQISGTVIGSINSDGAVVIVSGGCVKGTIVARAIQVAGLIERHVDGDIVSADGPLVLTSTAVVNCDAESAGIQTAYGAVMNGTFSPRVASERAVFVKVALPEPVQEVAYPHASPVVETTASTLTIADADDLPEFLKSRNHESS